MNSPAACAFCSGAFSVTVLPLIAVIAVAISVSALAWPISMLTPTRSPLVLATVIWVAPAGAAAVSVVSPNSPAVMGRTDCSKDRPVITPSEACGSN